MLKIDQIDQELCACEQELRMLRMQSGELESAKIRQDVVAGMMTGATARPARPAALYSESNFNSVRSMYYSYVGELYSYSMKIAGTGDERFVQSTFKTDEINWVERECVNAIDEMQKKFKTFDLGMDGSSEIYQKLGVIMFLWRLYRDRTS